MLSKANNNLKLMFGNVHVDINQSDIEKVYYRNVLSIEADNKTIKGSKNGSLTGIMYLAPSNMSGKEVCPFKSKGCAQACLNCAGHGRFYNTQKARVIKSLAFFMDRKRFIDTLKSSIKKLIVKARNRDMAPIVRLNGTSDINFLEVINSFPDVQFYDYTKNSNMFKVKLPSNYNLTFSLTESNDNDAYNILNNGGKVAVVFNGIIPNYYMGFKVINGDLSDERFKDTGRQIIGLYAKGKAKKDKSGFVR
jgi:hypothetical protein